MDVRDATEGDAERVAALTGTPTGTARELVHERTVRVAVREGTVVGVVAFDARPDAVHVTRLAGEHAAATRLLAEPKRFAERERMAVEYLAPEGDSGLDAAREAGFDDDGPGPRFEGKPTRRLRWTPGAA
jgi:hypothetical protein